MTPTEEICHKLAEFESLKGQGSLTADAASALAGRAADLVIEHNRSGEGCLRQAVNLICQLATSENSDVARAGITGLFPLLVERLNDSFDPAACRFYDQLFIQVIEFCRQLPEGQLLDEGLKQFGLMNENDLLARKAGLESKISNLEFQSSCQIPPQKILLLSRVTIGADVAVTSAIIAKLRQAMPQAEFVILGSRKLRQLYGGDDRIRIREIGYERGGSLIARLTSWLNVIAAVNEERRGFDKDEVWVIDPDSRLTQLGLLPLVENDDNYLFFESRSYCGNNVRSSAFRPQVRSSAFRPQVRSSAFRRQVRSSAFRPQVRSSAFRPQVRSSAFRPQVRSSAFRRQASDEDDLLKENKPPEGGTTNALSQHAASWSGELTDNHWKENQPPEGGTTYALSQLAASWSGELIGNHEPAYPFVALPEEHLNFGQLIVRSIRNPQSAIRNPVVAVSFGVGGNQSKRVSAEFEQQLIEHLLTDSKIILDKGASHDEREQINRIVAIVRAQGQVVIELTETNKAGIAEKDLLQSDVVTWDGGIGAFAGLIAASDEYIGYDSAGQHIAAALGVPTLTVFVNSNNATFGERWRPYGKGRIETVRVEAGQLANRADLSESILDRTLDLRQKLSAVC